MKGNASVLTITWADKLAAIGLAHVAREYPYKLDHVLGGPEDVATPRTLHPLFFGSYDWHSNVHTFWLLARVLRRMPALKQRDAVRDLFATRFTPGTVAGECAYFDRPSAGGFERPYGWAWLLALQVELRRHDASWAATLAPLAERMAERLKRFLPRATYPVRAGTHGNTAFALRLAADYAAAADAELGVLLEATARRWYGGDRDCQAWEPGGDDFLSSALTEAECMRRVLSGDDFATWFAAFLPRLALGEPETLLTPATVSDRTDGKIVHLDGLNLSRAWCWGALGPSFPEGHPIRLRAEAAADRHRSSLAALTGDYMGEHWLASFALLALDGL